MCLNSFSFFFTIIGCGTFDVEGDGCQRSSHLDIVVVSFEGPGSGECGGVVAGTWPLVNFSFLADKKGNSLSGNGYNDGTNSWRSSSALFEW